MEGYSPLDVHNAHMGKFTLPESMVVILPESMVVILPESKMVNLPEMCHFA